MSVAADVIAAYAKAGLMIATAESCTGGMIASALTDIAGSSAVLDRGFITYSNEAKADMLGVSLKTLETYGAVSEETAYEMAMGALEQSRADIAIAITGIAGPSGKSENKPIGLVYAGFAKYDRDKNHPQENKIVKVYKLLWGMDKTRAEVRHMTVIWGLKELLKFMT